MDNKNPIRLKVVLAEKQKTAKWLAGELNTNPSRVSKWCTGAASPSIDTLVSVAKVLNVDVKDLLNSTPTE